MKTITYYISNRQFLAELEPFKSSGLPTNSIIHKEITGCGATTLELEFNRNSIIIEPNLPVIRGKAEKMNGKKRKNKVILGVYENISIDDIKNYITNRKGYKKIVTTPEGFDKVIEAIGPTVFKDYFLLFDECEKVIQDVTFRDRITTPLSAFFNFVSKAFVSATPIIPSDPRFQDFTHVFVKPNYVYKQEIQVYPTNNIIFQLKKIIDSYNEYGQITERDFFIFFKSTQRIKHIIQGLKLDDYAVFCSSKSLRDLKSNGISNTFDRIKDKFSKYNFFTNRFFSAVDFDYKVYKCNPIIIILSDPMAIEHSVIDPATEAIQIIGRFRNPNIDEGVAQVEIVKDVYHITNYNTELTNYSGNEVDVILKDVGNLHKLVNSFTPISKFEYFNKFRLKILKMEGFNYFHWNSSLNYYMSDNFKDKEQIKGYYKTSTGLLNKYRDLERFVVNSKSEYKWFVLSDSDLRDMTSQTALLKVNKFVSLRLKELMETKIDAGYKTFNLEMLRASYPKQMNIIDGFGLNKAVVFDYDIHRIQQQKKNISVHDKLKDIKAYAKRAFVLKDYNSEQIKTILKVGIEETGLKGYQPNLSLLRKLVELSERHRIIVDSVKSKGYTIIKFYD